MAAYENTIIPFQNQVYEEIKKEHNRENLFVDTHFPADTKSLYYSAEIPEEYYEDLVWKRASEVINDPKFVIGNFEIANIDQGELGDCWFLSGVVGIINNRTLFSKVVPPAQCFAGDEYAGVFHFRFWRLGEWYDVVVDDFLPFDSEGELIFCGCIEKPNVLWGSLLEKAYAKFYGSYESLDGGFGCDGIRDMTGGVTESWELKNLEKIQKKNFWKILLNAIKKKSISVCGAPSSEKKGLVKGHVFSVINLAEFELNNEHIRLVKIRNPWGKPDDDNKGVWKGAWSVKSKEWNSLSDEIKLKNNLTIEDQGVFWMNYTDFMTSWEEVEIVHLDANCHELLENNATEHNWIQTRFLGQWKIIDDSIKNKDLFWLNPQYLIKINADEKDEENVGTVLISLLQDPPHLKRNKENNSSDIIFIIFKVNENVNIDEHISNREKLYANDLKQEDCSDESCEFELTEQFRLETGYYVIIPSLISETKNETFLLRIFTESPITSCELFVDKANLTNEEKEFDPPATESKVCQLM